MNNNPYIAHYVKQAQYGGSLPGFAGMRFQRGHGFFKKLFSGITTFAKDLLPSLAKRALPSAINLAQDVMAGENLGQSAKKRLVEAGKNVADETLDKLKNRLQSGSGIRMRILRKRNYLNKLLKKKTYKKKKKLIKRKRRNV